ncbi:glycosyltransferase family 4 protein [Dyadobacter chenwenxiniae]|uniref:Glycosyltransferase family 4 protein n=1 Tax=Dyadobacter chenwenxiniae TaxID=2906456 RepID=A0A9X1PMK6_9BACT|nr:glycosyltransferase family 1 protein [Dyadobacter chenwenxiniae]MCF0064162.1 glycosyltransferase family 4 protein [Dyadobacter chenwenxiniae]UON82889.1 glycosyltransferase family 4 protein [Dyadobacter chenwenxiniae]
MRIGFDAKRAFANKTGLGNYSRFVLDALLTYEKNQTYLAYTPKNNAKLFSDFPPDNIRLPQTFLNKKLSAYWRYASITTQLKAENINVFHGLSNELPQGLHKAGIRSAVTIHDLIFERLPHLFKPIDRIIYRHKFQSACRRADSVIAISEQTKRDLIALYNVDSEKIQVVYQDCNPIFKQPIENREKEQIRRLYDITGPYILCVGTLEERKNQHRLVEAFAHVASNDFQLILVGKPTSYTPKILEYIKKYKLENKVKILSNVPTAHLPALYQEAELFAYISVYEGFGIPILEALHSGTPVLAAKGSCLEEAGGPGGLYADPYQKEDISHQLSKLITDAALRTHLIEAGKQHITQFSGQNIAGQLVDLYKNLR